MIRDALDSLRQKRFIGVAELAGEAARLLSKSGVVQERGTVTEVPDERTLRYYISEGLISPARERQGTASVFDYRHLLQLLVVKNLQSQHLPIRKIRELVQGQSEKGLEAMLSGSTKTEAQNAATIYLESLLKEKSSAPPAPSVPPAAPSPAQSNIRTPPGVYGGTWERIEVEPGLELHIYGGYQPPTESRGVKRLAQRIISAIETYRQKLK